MPLDPICKRCQTREEKQKDIYSLCIEEGRVYIFDATSHPFIITAAVSNVTVSALHNLLTKPSIQYTHIMFIYKYTCTTINKCQESLELRNSIAKLKQTDLLESRTKGSALSILLILI
ncbi:hypothetical protein DM860_005466 [Cuscuta australis]|uniref:Uncharacterized protein n=1 Tax=Cuscuta australis TaxID=267555 RepID=A0A328E0U5_9ASTE|nr:hypothetical protein DM860_005466 [Cuscuta australis]